MNKISRHGLPEMGTVYKHQSQNPMGQLCIQETKMPNVTAAKRADLRKSQIGLIFFNRTLKTVRNVVQ